MVLVQPGLLRLCEKLRVDQLAAVRNHGNSFKTKERLVTKRVLCLDLLDNYNVLDTDAKFVVFVVARLVGNNISCAQRNLSVRNSRTDTDRALVNVEV